MATKNKIVFNVLHGRPTGKDAEGKTIYKNTQIGVVLKVGDRYVQKLNYIPANGEMFFNLWKPKPKVEPKPEPVVDPLEEDDSPF
jgi:hypothetical protein